MVLKKASNQVVAQNLCHKIKHLQTASQSYKNSKSKPCSYTNIIQFTYATQAFFESPRPF